MVHSKTARIPHNQTRHPHLIKTKEDWEEPTTIAYFIDDKGIKHDNPSLPIVNAICEGDHDFTLLPNDRFWRCAWCPQTKPVVEHKTIVATKGEADLIEKAEKEFIEANDIRKCKKCNHRIFWDEYWYCRICNGGDLDHGCEPME